MLLLQLKAQKHSRNATPKQPTDWEHLPRHGKFYTQTDFCFLSAAIAKVLSKTACNPPAFCTEQGPSTTMWDCYHQLHHHRDLEPVEVHVSLHGVRLRRFDIGKQWTLQLCTTVHMLLLPPLFPPFPLYSFFPSQAWILKCRDRGSFNKDLSLNLLKNILNLSCSSHEDKPKFSQSFPLKVLKPLTSSLYAPLTTFPYTTAEALRNIINAF